ncbi:hypothetical protein SAMN03159406_01570 [Rhizobium sp. NFR03]|nr:hypothetical protein SAMN03159406_01570 [Rhizobium sp. NFR03]
MLISTIDLASCVAADTVRSPYSYGIWTHLLLTSAPTRLGIGKNEEATGTAPLRVAVIQQASKPAHFRVIQRRY